MPVRTLALLVLFTGCAGREINESLRRKAIKPTSTTLAEGARALLEPPRLEAYTLGPLDVIQVEVFELREMGQTHVQRSEIDATGQITMPLIGRVACSGLTVNQVRDRVAERLGARFLASPQVAVKVADYKSKRVGVLGPVAVPGVVFLQQNQSTVVEALALAGGLTDQSGRTALLVREQVGADLAPAITIDLEDLTNGDMSQNHTVRPGDVIQVQPAERYYLTGYVTTPGEYVLRRRTSLLEAISIAGGVISPDASPDETYILRVGEPPIRCDLEAIVEGEAEDPLLQGGDLIQVRQGFWRGVTVGFYRFIKNGIGFGYNTATFLPGRGGSGSQGRGFQ